MARRKRKTSSPKTKLTITIRRSQKPLWARRTKRRVEPSHIPSPFEFVVPIRSSPKKKRGTLRNVKPQPVLLKNAQRFERETGARVLLTPEADCRKRKGYKKTMMRKLAAQKAVGGALHRWRKSLVRKTVYGC